MAEIGGAMRLPVLTQLTDQWMFAINLESILPGKIPLMPFFNIGLGKAPNLAKDFYNNDIFYVGGISLVIAEDIFEIYFPLMASDQIIDLYDGLNIDFHQKISFKINLPLLNPLEMIKL